MKTVSLTCLTVGILVTLISPRNDANASPGACDNRSAHCNCGDHFCDQCIVDSPCVYMVVIDHHGAANCCLDCDGDHICHSTTSEWWEQTCVITCPDFHGGETTQTFPCSTVVPGSPGGQCQ